jgi:hypothetical protein
MYTNNVELYKSELSIWKMEEYGFIYVSQLFYSFDLILYNFFLSSYLKWQLEKKIFFDENSIKKEII